MILLLLSCVGTNTEPRFMAVNGLDVKRLFGIPFLPDPIVVRPDEPVAIDITVVDRERDEIELIFPHAPVGWDFPRTGTTGTYTPSAQAWEYQELEVIALDEHGASEVMYMALLMPDAEWSMDTGMGGFDVGALFFGEVDVSEGFDGLVGLFVDDETAQCTFVWAETSLLSEPTDCAECDRAWAFTASGGETLDGDCTTVPMALPDLGEQRIGFASSYDYEGFPLENIVLTPVEGHGWVPLGEGSLEQDFFEFYLQVPEQAPPG